MKGRKKMEQLRNMNLPIVGRVQRGEQQILNQKRRVVELDIIKVELYVIV